MIKEKEGVRIYIEDDYINKAQVVGDLEEGKKVIIISNQEDVLSFYGAILENYGQYNLYLEEDISIVNDEYINEIYEVDMTKEDVVQYVGTPLTELVSQTIDSLTLNDKQKRIMGLIKELLKGNNDYKVKAEIDAKDKRIEQLMKDNKLLSEEITLYKTKEDKDKENSNRLTVVNTINIDNTRNQDVHIMYIKELERVKYVNTMLVQYQKTLEKQYKKRTKILIFDETIKWKYQDILSITSIEEYKANTVQNKKIPVMVVNAVYPIVVTDALNGDWDELIIYDRISGQDIVKGKRVSKFVVIATKPEYEAYKNSVDKKDDEKTTYIYDKDVGKTDGIIINKIKEDFTKDSKKYIIYNNMLNGGDDKRMIFKILNEKNLILNN